MYRRHILEHYKNPRNFGAVDEPDIDEDGENPTCGDELRVTAALEDGRIDAVKFEGHGCAISQAAASMLTEELQGEPVERAEGMGEDDVLDMLGIPVSPVRVKCAVLALVTLKGGLEDG
jgi:nitrogen fixation NifU-like protein